MMINIKNIKKNFGKIQALNGIDLEIRKGSFVSILGPNGAGKTTLIRILTGLIESDEGQILVNNEMMNRNVNNLKKKFGVSTQHINLDKELTVKENLIFSGKLYKMGKKEIKSRTDELLEKFGLKEKENVLSKKLSGGMKRKLMIAKAIIHNPEYIILDEPTVGIDVKARREIWGLLRELHSGGVTILLTTHYIEEAEKLCERVILVNKGEVIEDNSPQELIKIFGEYTVEFQNGDEKYEHFGTMQKAREYSATIDNTFSIRRTTLEDIFFKITTERIN